MSCHMKTTVCSKKKCLSYHWPPCIFSYSGFPLMKSMVLYWSIWINMDLLHHQRICDVWMIFAPWFPRNWKCRHKKNRCLEFLAQVNKCAKGPFQESHANLKIMPDRTCYSRCKNTAPPGNRTRVLRIEILLAVEVQPTWDGGP